VVVFLVDTLALAFAVSWVFVPALVLILLIKALREKPLDPATLAPRPADVPANPAEHNGSRRAVFTA
jgi:hypothetical protein